MLNVFIGPQMHKQGDKEVRNIDTDGAFILGFKKIYLDYDTTW